MRLPSGLHASLEALQPGRIVSEATFNLPCADRGPCSTLTATQLQFTNFLESELRTVLEKLAQTPALCGTLDVLAARSERSLEVKRLSEAGK